MQYKKTIMARVFQGEVQVGCSPIGNRKTGPPTVFSKFQKFSIKSNQFYPPLDFFENFKVSPSLAWSTLGNPHYDCCCSFITLIMTVIVHYYPNLLCITRALSKKSQNFQKKRCALCIMCVLSIKITNRNLLKFN